MLFDVDGTLLSAGTAALRAVREACRAIFERELAHDSSLFHGSLDPLIWRGICELNGIEDAEAHHGAFRRIYAERLLVHLEEEHASVALPGARELVDALSARDGLVLGLLTGNYPETGRAKVARAGLPLARFAVGAFGDDAADRRGLPPVAMQRCGELLGRSVSPAEVVVVGDTPKDVDCARASGCRSLAVATGHFTAHALRDAGADHVVDDLTDVERVVEWLVRR